MPISSSWRGFRLVMSRPSNTTRPARAGSSPNTVLNTVDLPAPFGPMMVVMAPRSACRLVPFRTVSPPYPATRSSRIKRLSANSVSKIGLDHGRIGADLLRRAFRDDAALGQHQDARAQRHDEFHVVLDHHEGGAPCSVDLAQ